MLRQLAPFAVLTLGSTALAQSSAAAVYEVEFDATWSSTTHPTAYIGSAHFSPLIGGTHSAVDQFWAPGALASPGIESMAESGGTFSLRQEVEAAIAAGTAGAVVQGGMVSVSPGAVMTSFELDAENSRITLVTMVAPSPDWFVGVNGVQLLVNGEWVDELTVDLLAWDAGTDSGTGFTSPNQDTNPAQPIVLQTGGPFMGDDPLGTFTFRRVSSAAVYGSNVNPAGSIRVLTGQPQLGGAITLGLSDPTGQLGAPLASLLFVSGNSASVTVPGLGLGPLGAPGEILVAAPVAATLVGPTIGVGAEASITIGVPNNPALIGLDYFAQGALVDVTAIRAGLTQGVELVIGG